MYSVLRLVFLRLIVSVVCSAVFLVFDKDTAVSLQLGFSFGRVCLCAPLC